MRSFFWKNGVAAPPPQDVSEHIDPLKYFSLNSFRNKLTPYQ